MSKNIPAVIYARFSSSSQREESIEDQLRECNAYAKREGYTVIGNYCDYAISGRTDERPEFLRMISDAEYGSFKAVIVYRLDRFARNRVDSVIYKSKLSKPPPNAFLKAVTACCWKRSMKRWHKSTVMIYPRLFAVAKKATQKIARLMVLYPLAIRLTK